MTKQKYLAMANALSEGRCKKGQSPDVMVSLFNEPPP
jgi:hypothetical protein